ncbi:hypothetical protein EDB83DRAFT_1409645 [Lactarius deliciosus]|nr:hypothetical protein EDB83DRAFT_1409645 [Lactarius deliciosus]
MRAESLGDGYDCLEEFVSTPTVENVLVKYINGMVTTCTKYGNLAMSTQREVVTGTDISDLRASFRHELAFSIPPSTLYRNYCSGAHSDLIFGVPLVDVETNKDNVPKVMRMCMEEVEKRGLNTREYIRLVVYMTRKYYSCGAGSKVKGFFRSALPTTVHSVAALLELYLLDLPEPLFMLSLQDYRNYIQNRARYTQNGFSLLRSKIRELRPVHRASLQALLRTSLACCLTFK